jgi:hypothetical protein
MGAGELSRAACHAADSALRNEGGCTGYPLPHAIVCLQPCQFQDMPQMNILAGIVMRLVQSLARVSTSEGDVKLLPYCLAGDFNFCPDDPPYALLTEVSVQSTSSATRLHLHLMPSDTKI